MRLRRRTKLAMVAAALIGGVVWVVLMDLGVNAGRIHYGVHVEGVAVGGMTFEEAVAVLESKAEELQEEPVVLSAEGMECSFVPEDLGWRAKTKRTVAIARDVGFGGGFVAALGDRLKAWFSGVEVEWARAMEGRRVRALIDDCEEQAVALGLELDRGRLRGLIARAIVTLPRRIFEVPVSRTT